MKYISWKIVFSIVGTILFPLLYLCNALVAYSFPATFRAPLSVSLLGSFLTVIGISIWIITMINLKKGFGVLPQKQKRIKTGLYKYFNHPMYGGIYMTFLGLSLANQSWQGLFFLNVFLLPTLVFRAVYEDKYLTD
jgi:protein-S-isoprenylcysteine O-methyltransferase Ste14